MIAQLTESFHCQLFNISLTFSKFYNWAWSWNCKNLIDVQCETTLNYMRLTFILFRSSITRSSQQDKFHSTREATVKETIKEEKVFNKTLRSDIFHCSLRRIHPETWSTSRTRNPPRILQSQVDNVVTVWFSFLSPSPECGANNIGYPDNTNTRCLCDPMYFL